mgnify:CR=1 FL=1
MPYVGKSPADIIATAVDTTTGTFSGDLTVDTNTLFVDSANNRVGVGTSSPDADLSLISPVYTSGGADNGIRFQNQNNSGDAIVQSYYSGTTPSALLHGANIYLSTGASFTPFDNTKANSYILQNTNGNIEFGNANSGTASERMRIDSSGRLLVGTTNTNPSGGNVEGTVIQSDGMLRISREGTSIEANIKGSDGNILVLKKDGSTVGSIGTNGGQPYFINSSNKGIRPYTNGVAAAGSAGAFDDASQDLGASSVRWRNLYLSGGVYLGGTGSANYLDDYEIGTFQVTVSTQTSGTITVNSTFDTLSYTKIGRMVSISGIFGISSVSSPVGTFFLINGFPFNTGDLSELGGRASAHISFADSSASTVTSVGTLMLESTNQLRVYVNCASVGAGDDFYVNFSYFTS